jgi:hypothetical protein
VRKSKFFPVEDCPAASNATSIVSTTRAALITTTWPAGDRGRHRDSALEGRNRHNYFFSLQLLRIAREKVGHRQGL